MGKKVFVEELDPTKKVARVLYSSEQATPQYFDENDNRIAVVEKEVDYTPEYDVEIGSKRFGLYKFEVYKDVHRRIAVFWFPFQFLGQLLVVLPIVLINKAWSKL